MFSCISQRLRRARRLRELRRRYRGRALDDRTAREHLAAVPEEWREWATYAIFACMDNGWPLHTANIQVMCRALQHGEY